VRRNGRVSQVSNTFYGGSHGEDGGKCRLKRQEYGIDKPTTSNIVETSTIGDLMPKNSPGL